MDKVFLYDTTLRDGAQGEGISFSDAAKLRFARLLDEFGVDFIEGGFAGSNPRDRRFFEDIRKERLSQARVTAFGSTRRVDVDETEPPRVQEQSMHAEMLADQAIVIAAAVTGVAEQVVRDMMEMASDLPIASGFRRDFEQGVALLRVANHFDRNLDAREATPTRECRLGFALKTRARQRIVDFSRFGRPAAHDGQIGLLHRARHQLAPEITGHLG